MVCTLGNVDVTGISEEVAAQLRDLDIRVIIVGDWFFRQKNAPPVTAGQRV